MYVRKTLDITVQLTLLLQVPIYLRTQLVPTKAWKIIPRDPVSCEDLQRDPIPVGTCKRKQSMSVRLPQVYAALFPARNQLSSPVLAVFTNGPTCWDGSGSST
jgi:hypothetical protein